MTDFKSLPVYQHRQEILDALENNQVIIVESPTGSGKTTQIPIILKEAGYASKGIIGITQPRRIATLGVCSYIKSQVAAEGLLIEGASEGKGLGLRFLRHIERNSLLLFMVPGDTDDIKKEYEILLNELAQFNPDMLDKHRVLAVTKCDLLDEELIEMLRETLPEDLPVVFISAVTGFGLDELKDVLWRELNAESNKLAVAISEDTLVHRDKDMTRFAEELADEGEDEDIVYLDEDEIEDLDDFEYDDDEGDEA